MEEGGAESLDVDTGAALRPHVLHVMPADKGETERLTERTCYYLSRAVLWASRRSLASSALPRLERRLTARLAVLGPPCRDLSGVTFSSLLSTVSSPPFRKLVASHTSRSLTDISGYFLNSSSASLISSTACSNSL